MSWGPRLSAARTEQFQEIYEVYNNDRPPPFPPRICAVGLPAMYFFVQFSVFVWFVTMSKFMMRFQASSHHGFLDVFVLAHS